MKTHITIGTVNIGPGQLLECKMAKEEFLLKTKVEHPFYDMKAIDYDEETGDLTVEYRERNQN